MGAWDSRERPTEPLSFRITKTDMALLKKLVAAKGGDITGVERSIERRKFFQERRKELRKLLGHAKLKNGEIISINEATEKLRTNVIGPEDIEQWFLPEGVRDVLNSIEVDAIGEYPALGISFSLQRGNPR